MRKTAAADRSSTWRNSRFGVSCSPQDNPVWIDAKTRQVSSQKLETFRRSGGEPAPESFKIARNGPVVFLREKLPQMQFADQGRENMRSLKIEIVIGAVEIRGHDGYKIGSVLFVVVSAQLDSRYLGYGIGLICRFQF